MSPHGPSSRRRSSRSRSPERVSTSSSRPSSSRRRSRSRSPEARKKRRDDRDRDHDDDDREDGGGPPAGVGEIDGEDYFLKTTELKVWLDEEKGKVSPLSAGRVEIGRAAQS